MPSSRPSPAADRPLRVLRRLGCFLLPLVLFWGVLEVGMSRVPNIFSVKHDRCLALAPELDTIVVGSSNAFSGINPAFLSGSAFNLAVPSQTHYYDERISRIAMAHLPHLKRIIVCVTYVSLFWQAYESPEAWRQYYFRQEWGIPPVRPEDRWNIKNWSRVALDSPETSFNQLCKGFRKSRAREVDPRGWNTSLTQGKPKDLLDPAAALRVAGHDALASPANVPANLGYLESLIAQAQARNIEVVLVTLPVWPTYRAHIRQDYWNQTRTAMEALAARHHIRYLNFFQYPGMSAEDYYDSDHLSAAGGIHFTQLLDTSLNSPPDPGERP